MRNEYRANLTGVGFLLYEFKETIKLNLVEADAKIIKDKIYEENIFQYSKPSALKRIVPTVVRRVEVIEDDLKRLALEDSIDTARLINLLAIIEEDDLFYAFMNEVIKDAYKKNDLLFGKGKVNIFFSDKAEQDERVSKFKESTRNKLRQVYLKILIESGLLTSIKDGELVRVHIDEYIKSKLIDSGYSYFIDILEGK